MKVDVEKLYFSYASKTVLKDISFHVSYGEIVCIVGPNGSGKSTLIKCMGSLLKIQSGRVLIDGVDAGRLTPAVHARQVGYMAQTQAPCFSKTVFDTVLMGRRPYSSWYSSRKDIQMVAGILEQMGLAQIALEKVNCLSGGQRQRVFMARALAQEPEILLLDEPTSALDIAHQLDTMDMVYSLSRTQKISVVMILHDLNLAARYADRIVMLHQGKVHIQGDARQVFTSCNMKTVYGVTARIQEQDGFVSILPVKRCSSDAFPISKQGEQSVQM